jgi:SAM-dependent methyltransferase
MSETAKYRHLTVRHLWGCGIDIGCGADPVTPWAIRFDLPAAEYATYNSGEDSRLHHIQLRGDCRSLPFKDGALDFVYSSHVLEDFADWTPVLAEWVRVLKPGGHLVILIPDKKRWEEALRNGQPPNCAHQHEGYVGELTLYANELGVIPIVDALTDTCPGDYSILFVGRKDLA